MHLKYIYGREVESTHSRISLELITAEVRVQVHGSSLYCSHYFCIHLKISTKQTKEENKRSRLVSSWLRDSRRKGWT